MSHDETDLYDDRIDTDTSQKFNTMYETEKIKNPLNDRDLDPWI